MTIEKITEEFEQTIEKLGFEYNMDYSDQVFRHYSSLFSSKKRHKNKDNKNFDEYFFKVFPRYVRKHYKI